MKGLFKALVLVSLALAILLTMASCENIVNKIPFLDGPDANEQTTSAPEELTTPVETPEQTTPQEHTHIIVIDEAVAPTCTKAGLTEGQHCSECKEVLVAQKEIPALGHKYDAVVTDPTCTESGYTTYTCHCGDTYVADEVPALGHKSIPATCTSPETCEVCGIELSPAINHSYTAVVTAPTCTADGYTTYTCSCGDTYTEAIPASGHKYETVVTAPTCTEDGYTTYTCHCGHSYVADTVKAPGHTYNSVVTEPTCVVDGYTTYTCQCGHSYTEAIPALGHDKVAHDAKDATCTEAGHNAYVTCTRCDYTTFEEIKALGHDEVAHDAKDATCTEAGHKAYVTCSRCDYTTFEEINALGHDEVAHGAKAPTCTEAGNEAYVTCSRCDYTTFVEIKALGHDEVAHDAKDATCTEAGNKAYVTCTRCDYTTFEEIKALGHDEVAHDAKAPTCTEKGNEAYVTCTRCDYTTFKEIDVLDHTEVAIPAKKATCTETGLTAGVKCSVCGEVLIAPTTTNALGHDEVAHDAKAPTCTEAGHNAYVTCTRCDYTTFEEIPALGHDEVAHDAKAPTCTEAGNEAYVTCSRCDYTTFKAINALGHDEVAHDAKAPTCTEAGNEAYVTCSRCDYTTFEEIKALGHNEIAHDAKAPTCTDKGNKAYVTCSRCDYTTFEEIAATGHTETKIPGKPATCTATGLTDGVKCSVCNAELKEQEEIPARGHDERTLAAEAATCTKEGLTEGKYCFECGETLVKQTTVPKLPHTYDDDTDLVCNVCSAERACLHAETIIVPGKSATCTEPGLKDGKKCKICGDTVVAQETIPATGHQNQVKIPAVMPDCTTDGATEGLKCYTCGTVIVKPSVIPAKGHTEKVLAAVAATCTKTGLTEGKQCSVCNEILVPQETIPMQDHTYSETWTKDGNTHWHACTRCGAKADESAHAYTTEISRVEATCEKDGKYTLKCDCGATKDVVISATGHTESTWIIDTEATCTTDGSKHIECTVCKKVLKTETIEKLGHDEVAHDAKDATCTDKGYKAYVTCTRCDYTTFEETAALGHDEVAHDAKAPTCTEKGNEAYVTCTRCDYTTFKALDVLDHTEEAIPAKKATCTETGLTSGIKCSVCGEVLIAPTTTDALGHDEVAHNAKDATCTEAGHNAYVTCTRCDYTTFEETDALGHDEVAHDAKEATCTEAGHNAYVTCTRCDYTTFEEIGALGHDEVAHDAKEATCTEAGHNAYVTCTRCDYTTFEETDALGHDYKATVTDPTCTEKGYTTHTCANCGDSYKDTDVDALGHIDEDGNYLCDNHCTTVMPPEADSVLTIPQANALGMAHAENTYTTGKYYVTGVIVSIENTTYGNIYIEDAEGNSFYIYGLYVNGTRYDKMEDQPQVGQTITVYGIIGTYTGTDPQMKEAELIPCEHSFEETGRENASCDKAGSITNVCSLCNKVVTEIIEAPGHNYVNHKCSVCGKRETVVTNVATFDFGENGTNTQHVDGNSLGTSKSYTVGDYTLALTGMSSVYGPAYDLQHNSCIKLGTSKVIGSFSFTVPDDVTKVIIHVAGYKAKTVTVTVNGVSHAITKTSDKGEYFELVIDTSTDKTISFATTSTGYRAMINTIAFYAEKEIPCEHTNKITQGASDATCTEAGYTGDTYCPDCETTIKYGEEIEALGHKYGEWIIDQPATEEAEGKKHRVCEVCDDVEEDTIPKLSHVHTEETIPAVAPTCTKTGLTAGVKCSACGEIITAQEEVPALGHTEVIDEAVDATCTATGLTEGKHCEVCNEVLVKQEVVAITAHSYVDHICAGCGKEDPNHYFEMTIPEALAAKDDKKVSVTGTVVEINTPWDSSYKNITVTIADENGNKLYLYRLSANVDLGDVITVNGVMDTYNNNRQIAQGATATIVTKHTCSEYTEATCTEAAKCTVCGKVSGEALGHTTENGTCERCGEEIKTVLLDKAAIFDFGTNGAASHNDGSDMGASKTYTVENYSLAITGATKVYTGARDAMGNSCLKLGTGSVAGSFSFTVASDIEKVIIYVAGYKANTAKVKVNGTEYSISLTSNGGEYNAIEIDTSKVKMIFFEVSSGYRVMINTIEFYTIACDHDYQETESKDATCAETGYIIETCTKCGKAKKEEVAALGHKYESVVTDPTCEAVGYTTYTCACGDTYTADEVAALGHEMGDWEETTAPTCTTNGEETRVCTRDNCNYSETNELLMVDHTYVDGMCSVCGTLSHTHEYDNDCDAICNICDAEREVGEHVYDNTCDTNCNICGAEREINHTYDNDCDTICNVCEAEREITHAPGDAATCTTAQTCTVCGTELAAATGVHNYQNGKCTMCGAQDPNAPKVLATFNLGANGSASHYDGPSSKTTYSETVGNYKLNITGGTNFYTGARDAKGNSCFKLGTSSKTGSFTFTVGADVNQVIIYVAKYKSNTTKVTVNGGTAQTLTKASNNGEYDMIIIDTSTNKTVTFATASGGVRAMVNTIEFWS